MLLYFAGLLVDMKVISMSSRPQTGHKRRQPCRTRVTLLPISDDTIFFTAMTVHDQGTLCVATPGIAPTAVETLGAVAIGLCCSVQQQPHATTTPQTPTSYTPLRAPPQDAAAAVLHLDGMITTTPKRNRPAPPTPACPPLPAALLLKQQHNPHPPAPQPPPPPPNTTVACINTHPAYSIIPQP